ncbi:formate dehydrogenase accessory protein FdhE [Pollutimonas harenae]|uniref:Protein FdhE homolog n=1 Tax=Pollutimonas harenae TaxID=657015 RepID=A0A853GSI0_9BURK|nr:formate dehydrogenase accessory protein FdhE [Pollutimonas harenae]NYT85117.1 formate dehydrogenase accessory protein FdhE [Pollutimonas harenae]TEA72502.1 formate dehydrogenase accessory protein FdhE [Pollutimonas harenae]
MQRILPRGEIESLDHTTIPRLRQPVRASVFADRAARLRQLAPNHPLSTYLLLMADLADGQGKALKHSHMPGPGSERIDLAQAHGMPPLQATGWERDPGWRDLLAGLLEHMSGLTNLPPQALEIAQALKQRLNDDPAAIEAQADALLAEREEDVDAATAPFIMAALQVYWTGLAADFQESALPVVTPHGVCPLCGSLPVASIVHVGGQADACRYLCCSLCSAEWHLVRVTCSHCENTKQIAYHAIEGGPEGIKAESCDHCHTYRKIFYQEKVLGVDAIADDLASLTLDMLMGDAGYSRASGNPLLWQHAQVES